VHSHIGDRIQPVPDLGLDIGQIDKGSQGPKIPADIFYGGFHFSLGLSHQLHPFGI